MEERRYGHLSRRAERIPARACTVQSRCDREQACEGHGLHLCQFERRGCRAWISLRRMRADEDQISKQTVPGVSMNRNTMSAQEADPAKVDV